MRRGAEIEALAERLARLEVGRGDVDSARRDIDRIGEWLGAITERVEATGGLTDAQETRLSELVAAQQMLRERLHVLERRVPGADSLVELGQSGLEQFDAGLGGTVIGFRGGGPARGERVYLDFEDVFRGSEDAIRERQRAYLPLLEGRGPVLDVGCGRGELLVLLDAAGIAAEGIDSDPGMVAHCHDRGLRDVRQATAVEFLSAAQPRTYGSVVALQVIEHLPYRSLVDFLHAAREAIAPGGRLVVETVNPHTPQALKHFWIDPTHQHPLFPEVTLLLCRLSGFAEGFIWYPAGSGDPARDRTSQPDYAVVATS